MRSALASLIITATVVSAVQAQTPPAPTPPAAEPAQAAQAPAAAAPAATAPATPSVAAPPSTAAPAAPSAPAATPQAPAAPAPVAEAPPALPTTGNGAVLLSIVEKVCVPLVRGGDLDKLAPQIAGMKKNRRDGTWTLQLGGASRDYIVTLFPVGVNKDVCRGEVHYAFDDEKDIVNALNVWSFLHQPELILQANYVSVNADGVKRVQKSWEHLDATSSTAVNFTSWTKPDDTPLNPKYATGELFYQERKLS